MASRLRFDGVPASRSIAVPAAGVRPREPAWHERALLAVTILGLGAACAQGLWRTTLWGAAEPRAMDIARDQYAHGLVRSLTLSGMPFLEEPPFYFDVTAVAFHVSGGASVFAARAVVALFAMSWAAAVVLVVRRAAGPRAAMLAGALLVVAPGFSSLARRLGVDIALVAALSFAMLFLFMAIDDDRERIDGRWWWASLAATGCAALTKGLFGSLLFLAPTLAYAALARDRRIVAALLRPASLALLLLPHALWGLELYGSGGATFVFEHFVNNTLGRVLHHRFYVADVGGLPYGDVGAPYAWHYCLSEVPTGAVPAIVAVPFAVWEQRARGGFRARDAESRLLGLALCWGCVPPILLSFSVYKGRGHLGASSAALVVVGALWLARRLRMTSGAADPAPRWARVGVAAMYAVAPALLAASFLGLPATPTGANVVLGAVAGVAAMGIVAALAFRQRGAALGFLLAGAAAACVADSSPGASVRNDEVKSLDAVARWVAQEAGDAPVAVCLPKLGDKSEAIGQAEEQSIVALAYWLGRPLVILQSAEQVRPFLRQETPAFFVACTDDGKPPTWPSREDAVEWTDSRSNHDTTCTLIANRAAARRRVPPTVAPAQLDALGR
jgi:4-amino-4-deoxy-L-arabinose transferase-like glycosyltransferase